MTAAEEDDFDYLGADDEQASLDRIAAERKRRRAEILFKYATEDGATQSLAPKRERADEKESAAGSKRRKAELMKGNSSRSTALIATDTDRAGAVASAEYDERNERQMEAGEDMFSLDGGFDAGPAELVKSKGANERKVLGHAVDDEDDPSGYYRTTLGELLDEGRYQVFATVGKGVFSTVVRARDTQESNKEVAIKIARSQETMYKAGLKEVAILKRITEADPDDKRHVVRLERDFVHRNHLCMVFEPLSMNLREVIKKFGRDVGLNIRAVKAYAHQMFLALSLMAKLNIVHADLKPDNILVNDTKAILKVCDLGSASDSSQTEITPYLVSRFYRAPEIILGLPYNAAIDMWAVGCTLFELYTGKILFPGRSNNQMLFMMQDLKGRFTVKQTRRSKFGPSHFDEQNNFLLNDVDKSTGQPIVKRVAVTGPKADLKSRLIPDSAQKSLPADELRLLKQFVDLLDKALDLDPSKRISPREALSHPFLM